MHKRPSLIPALALALAALGIGPAASAAAPPSAAGRTAAPPPAAAPAPGANAPGSAPPAAPPPQPNGPGAAPPPGANTPEPPPPGIAPPPPPPPPPPGAPRPHPKHRRPRHGPPPAKASVEIQGTVRQLLLDPQGRVNGLLLADGTEISFAPQDPAIAATLRRGMHVSANGDAGPRPLWLHARSIAIRDPNGLLIQSLDAHPPAPPPPAWSLPSMTAAGAIDSLLHGPRGDINGLVLDDGTVVRFPPHLGERFGAVLEPGRQVSVSGHGRASAAGRALEATSIYMLTH